VQIDISFVTWKALTARLEDEADTYDALISRLLHERPAEDDGSQERNKSTGSSSGAVFKGVFLPDGTELRGTHRGKTFLASIVAGQWIDGETGERRSSPSQAAFAITQSGVNGWLFWLVKRPADKGWRSLNELRSR
jgi:hypothetical protein